MLIGYEVKVWNDHRRDFNTEELGRAQTLMETYELISQHMEGILSLPAYDIYSFFIEDKESDFLEWSNDKDALRIIANTRHTQYRYLIQKFYYFPEDNYLLRALRLKALRGGATTADLGFSDYGEKIYLEHILAQYPANLLFFMFSWILTQTDNEVPDLLEEHYTFMRNHDEKILPILLWKHREFFTDGLSDYLHSIRHDVKSLQKMPVQESYFTEDMFHTRTEDWGRKESYYSFFRTLTMMELQLVFYDIHFRLDAEIKQNDIFQQFTFAMLKSKTDEERYTLGSRRLIAHTLADIYLKNYWRLPDLIALELRMEKQSKLLEEFK